MITQTLSIKILLFSPKLSYFQGQCDIPSVTWKIKPTDPLKLPDGVQAGIRNFASGTP